MNLQNLSKALSAFTFMAVLSASVVADPYNECLQRVNSDCSAAFNPLDNPDGFWQCLDEKSSVCLGVLVPIEPLPWGGVYRDTEDARIGLEGI